MNGYTRALNEAPGDQRRVAIFQVGPNYPRVFDNGVEAVLDPILQGLQHAGARVKIYQRSGDRNRHRKRSVGGADLVDLYRLLPSQSMAEFPGPFDLAHAAAVSSAALERAEAVLLHGGGLGVPLSEQLAQFPGLKLAGIHDLTYDGSLLRPLELRLDALVVPSRYMRDSISAISRHMDPRQIPIHVIPNGFSLNPDAQRASKLRSRFGLSPDSIVILHPHRADFSKGIMESLQVVASLRQIMSTASFSRVVLLVPTRSAVSTDPYAFEVDRIARELGIHKHVTLHGWIGVEDRDSYLSLGSAALCLGEYPEGFGNVHIECSMLGVPVIAARVGAHRSVLEEGMIAKVDPGDLASAAECLAELLTSKNKVPVEVSEAVKLQFQSGAMGISYTELLLNESKNNYLNESKASFRGQTTVVRPPPWCYISSHGYYNDFGGYTSDADLISNLPELIDGIDPSSEKWRAREMSEMLSGWLGGGWAVEAPLLAQ